MDYSSDYEFQWQLIHWVIREIYIGIDRSVVDKMNILKRLWIHGSIKERLQ